MNKVFLDTNILLDYILERGTNGVVAEELINDCVRGEIECCVAPHTLTNIFYILRKTHSVAERKFIIKNIIAICEVQAMDRALIEKAIDDERFEDFEDALQMACAEKWGADRLVTRDQEFF